MAEVKNSFLKSKMNQDLDDRLIPNGEYRYANNISVGKSETDDIGSLKNVLGNELLTLTDNSEFLVGTNTPNPNYIPGLECIGAFMDNQNNRIFQFLTNYTDPNPNLITFPEDAPFTTGITEWVMKIVMYDFDNPTVYVTLVDGLFLNFAKNKEFRITGVNLVEGLLFWTDNRNQPRKINVANATVNTNYYTTEEQISVAKYAPIEPISLYRKAVTTADGSSSVDTLDVASSAGIVPGMTLLTDGITGSDFCTVVSVVGTTITFYQPLPITIADGTELTFLISTMSDKSDVPSWPGDPAFLEDKYVRFSYRFKYDDNEYSLMSPFTQIAYIPKQKGYFIDGNETDAYRSTIINWFENNVNNIELIVPFPDKVGNLTNSYKIVEIDILYKESDSTAVKVFETIPISAINTLANSNNNFYVQPYQSQKPYKTLPEDQTTRVYDKVPVRARAQESAGNRIIYGNYYDKYTSLSSINYNISVQPKSTTGTNFIEYPNHTLKRNRNYQVGFVLADKFGRQSPVILSSVDLLSPTIDGVKTKGSTIYSSYENTVLFDDVRSWFGDALILYLNAPINQDRYIPSGQPGLYAIPTSNFGFAITTLTQTGVNQYVFTMDITALDSQYVPVIGNILRGKYVDYVKVLDSIPTYQTPGNPLTPIVSVAITTSGEINDIYNYSDPGGGLADIKFAYYYNPVGWYSYKVVVKQQEQDYYNVYLPGMLNGYPKNQTSGSQVTYSSTGVASMQTGVNTTQFPVSETGKTSHIVLINDNINKVPRDLSEVGPDQKQYRSSIQLYGRVENTKATLEIIGEDPLYSAKVTTIKYSTLTVGNEDWALIKPGDGIQCVEANTPVADTTPPATAGATMPNPYRWLGNTVVVSNVVDGTTGTITISSPNWVIDTGNPLTTYKNFIITRAENVQYFPTRKADTVISIATADEFNFIDSSEDNLSGTAGLNFYQLQNKPLIGRVSTTNDIGVIAADMIPFLSVYETRAEQSLLEIFWETATTGLISDLNADVLTGFNGPSGFGNFEYKHFENQDPNGPDTDPNNYGQPDSKYITDLFYVVNQNGIILPNTTVTLTGVIDGNGNNRLLDFGIVASNDGTNDLYRLFITGNSPFVFNYQPPFIESYTFTFNVVDIDDPSTASELVINGRLGNIGPEITTIQTNYNITQNTTTFVTLEANNGSFTEAITGLKWSIIGGDTTIPSFNISPYTGVLSLINDEIPLGVYNLVIKVQDAVNTNDGQALDPINTDFGSKSSTITLSVNVGDEPVPYWLRPNYESSPIQSQAVCGSVSANDAGFVYIGPVANPSSTYFPTIPGFSGTYDIIENIEVENAENYSLNNIQPTGLREGEYRVSVKLDVFAIPICPVFPQPTTSSSFAQGKAKIYLYRRIYTAAGTNAWALVNNENNFGISPVYEIGPLSVSTFDDGSGPIAGPTKSLTTSFTIQASDTVDELYEYAIGFKLESEFNNAGGLNGPKITVYGNDANYAYSIPPALPVQPFSPPIANEYEYYTGVVDFATNYTSGVPYTTQDAIRGIDYNSPTNAIASGMANNGVQLVILTLSSINNQIVSGMDCGLEAVGYNIGFPVLGKIVYVNPANPAEITLQLNDSGGWPYLTTPLNLGNLSVETTVFDPLLPIGKLYANTIEGTEIRRFYTDANFTQKWIPPVADRFYNFITSKNYNPGGVAFQPSGILKYSEFPYYCAFVKGDGEIALQTGTTPNVQTAWSGQNPQNTLPIDIANYSYNVLYTETPAP